MHAEANDDNPAIEPQRILIADDIPANIVMLESILAGNGIEIIKAHSGKEAIAALHDSDHDISLALLDVVMPDMDGFEVARAIRRNPHTKYIPIIFVTASDKSDRHVVRSYESGAVDVLYKPLQPEVIRSKVKIFLELDQQRRLIKQQSQELKRAFAQLQHYAQHDQLTGLYNREQISNILTQLISRANRESALMGLLFLDLDHFKNVNDSLGHDVGDMLLQSVADRIKNSIRGSDFVARLGGDEFAVVLSELDSPESAALVAQKILDQLVIPHSLKSHEILVSSSIGIALYDDKHKTPSALLKAADAAMYQAKRKGRSQYAYYSPDLEEQAMKRMEIARSLNEAIDRDELSMFYQPQISARNGQLVGFEALMRWRRHDTWVSPALFIPIAEETGLIPKLGDWVLQTCCKQMKQWLDERLITTDVKVAVNISNRQIQAGNFITVLQRALDESKLPPVYLELELTESTVMDDPQTTISIFNRIHELGVEISVDDFGTGYSSLNYLRQLPLDRLKIDQSFVKDISVDRGDEAIVKAIIGLSHNLGLTVVAEGVETELQSQFLRDHDCDVLQGYYFSKPIPADEIQGYLLNLNSSSG